MTTQKFEELIIENKHFLDPFAWNLTQDKDDAKDLVQDTIYRALVNKDKFQEETNIRAWLFTMMRNLFINNYRRQKRFMKVSSDVPEDYYFYQKNKVAYNDGVMRSELNEINKQIQALPEILKVSFKLHYAGYKYQEIADVLNEPVGTIKSRIHFCRKVLVTRIIRY